GIRAEGHGSRSTLGTSKTSRPAPFKSSHGHNPCGASNKRGEGSVQSRRSSVDGGNEKMCSSRHTHGFFFFPFEWRRRRMGKEHWLCTLLMNK
ncbi:hypothetical protein VIGAN_08268100, partial [Vigna angularis var. angularis]